MSQASARRRVNPNTCIIHVQFNYHLHLRYFEILVHTSCIQEPSMTQSATLGNYRHDRFAEIDLQPFLTGDFESVRVEAELV